MLLLPLLIPLWKFISSANILVNHRFLNLHGFEAQWHSGGCQRAEEASEETLFALFSSTKPLCFERDSIYV